MPIINESNQSRDSLNYLGPANCAQRRLGSDAIPVSVIIPCYMCAGTIDRAVASVFSQTALPRQIILADDGNERSFRELTARLAEKSPVRDFLILHNQRNIGPSATRNKAWEAASQPFIAFLDADDAWHPCKLERQHALFASDRQLQLAAHRSICVKEPFQPEERHLYGSVIPITSWALLVSNFFSTPTVMLRRDLPFRFDVRMKYAEDYDLWARIILNGCKGVFDSAPMTFLFKNRFGEGGLSSRLFSMERGVQRVYRHLSHAGLISVQAAYLLRFCSSLKFLKRIIQTAIFRIKR